MNIPDSKYITDRSSELWNQISREIGYGSSPVDSVTFSLKTVRLLVRDFYMKGFVDGMNHSCGTYKSPIVNHHKKP